MPKRRADPSPAKVVAKQKAKSKAKAKVKAEHEPGKRNLTIDAWAAGPSTATSEGQQRQPKQRRLGQKTSIGASGVKEEQEEESLEAAMGAIVREACDTAADQHGEQEQVSADPPGKLLDYVTCSLRKGFKNLYFTQGSGYCLKFELQRARDDPLFNDFVEHERAQIAMVDKSVAEQWEFGNDEVSEPTDDLQLFIQYVRKYMLQTQIREEVAETALVAAEPAPSLFPPALEAAAPSTLIDTTEPTQPIDTDPEPPHQEPMPPMPMPMPLAMPMPMPPMPQPMPMPVEKETEDQPPAEDAVAVTPTEPQLAAADTHADADAETQPAQLGGADAGAEAARVENETQAQNEIEKPKELLQLDYFTCDIDDLSPYFASGSYACAAEVERAKNHPRFAAFV